MKVLLLVVARRADVMAHDYFISIISEASDNGIEQQPTPYFLLLPSRRCSSRKETKDMERGIDDLVACRPSFNGAAIPEAYLNVCSALKQGSVQDAVPH
jgi:hypothetical protein